ncbi:MAG: Rap1a/Tai family immunity protein [Sphingomonas sp.]
MIGLLMMLAADVTSAGLVTGDQLLDWCQSRSIQCESYAQGVVDTWMGEQAFGRVPNMICVTPGMTSGQISDAVQNYLTAHPERRSTKASSLVVIALAGAFPCPKAG